MLRQAAALTTLLVAASCGGGGGNGGGPAGPSLSISTSSLPTGTVGVVYNATLEASDGTPPYAWNIDTGSLPDGLLLNRPAAGTINGTPTAYGTSTFTLRVRDAQGLVADRVLSLTVDPAPLQIATATLPAGAVGVAYDAQLAATGGATPHTWSVSTGALPGGLSLDGATGAISGMPAATGTAAFTLRVRDARGVTAEKPLSFATAWVRMIPDGAAGSPSRRTGHAMVWDGQKVILFGGEDISSGGGVPTYRHNDLWWYDPATNTWTERIPHGSPGSPSPRTGHAMVWDGTRVIMFGGYPYVPMAGTLNDLWWYDPQSNTWTMKIPHNNVAGSPEPRYFHTLVWDGAHAILFGGAIDTGGHYRNDVWWYDPTQNAWAEKIGSNPGAPGARVYHDAVWDGTRMVMFQGETPSDNAYRDYWWYNPAANDWVDMTRGTRPEEGRFGHTLVWDGARAILFGGSPGKTVYTPITQSELWWYDPPSNTWVDKSADVPPALIPVRATHRAVWTGTRMIVFGGEGSNDLWWYVP